MHGHVDEPSIYNDKARKFEIFADRHILKNDGLIRLIVREFHLEKSYVEFKTGEHYRCAVCENESNTHCSERD